eukprot:scaffold101_cov230-Pinguiococcus_pyrenoidosus.AAC.19
MLDAPGGTLSEAGESAGSGRRLANEVVVDWHRFAATLPNHLTLMGLVVDVAQYCLIDDLGRCPDLGRNGGENAPSSAPSAAPTASSERRPSGSEGDALKRGKTGETPDYEALIKEMPPVTSVYVARLVDPRYNFFQQSSQYVRHAPFNRAGFGAKLMFGNGPNLSDLDIHDDLKKPRYFVVSWLSKGDQDTMYYCVDYLPELSGKQPDPSSVPPDNSAPQRVSHSGGFQMNDDRSSEAISHGWPSFWTVDAIVAFQVPVEHTGQARADGNELHSEEQQWYRLTKPSAPPERFPYDTFNFRLVKEVNWGEEGLSDLPRVLPADRWTGDDVNFGCAEHCMSRCISPEDFARRAETASVSIGQGGRYLVIGDTHSRPVWFPLRTKLYMAAWTGPQSRSIFFDENTFGIRKFGAEELQKRNDDIDSCKRTDKPKGKQGNKNYKRQLIARKSSGEEHGATCSHRVCVSSGGLFYKVFDNEQRQEKITGTWWVDDASEAFAEQASLTDIGGVKLLCLTACGPHGTSCEVGEWCGSRGVLFESGWQVEHILEENLFTKTRDVLRRLPSGEWHVSYIANYVVATASWNQGLNSFANPQRRWTARAELAHGEMYKEKEVVYGPEILECVKTLVGPLVVGENLTRIREEGRYGCAPVAFASDACKAFFPELQ